MSKSANQEPLLSAHALSTWRGERLLFSNVDFEVSTGDILHIRGTNGSGKTTLLRMLCGLRPINEGVVKWRGDALPEATAALREGIAFVGHTDGIKLELTALQNAEALTALRGGAVAMQPTDALTRAGLGTVLNVEGRALSAGQRRRLALSTLLVRAKRLWILDEPFTALDHDGTTFAADLMREQASTGGAVIVTSHQELPKAIGSVCYLDLSA